MVCAVFCMETKLMFSVW